MIRLLSERERNSGYRPSHLKYVIWHGGNTCIIFAETFGYKTTFDVLVNYASKLSDTED